MPLGFKVADIYAELNLDKDELRGALRGLPATMGADADRAGQELGKKMTDGLARSVEASSAKLTKARRSEVEATKAVQVAELRLKEAREKGNRPASALLALENGLEKAHYRLAQAQTNTVTSTKKLEDAQRRLSTAMGDVGKDLGPSAQKAGDDAGGKLALGMRMSIIRNSPLIVAAVGAGLAAGGPAMLAGATALFAGIGIVAAAQTDKVKSAFLGMWTDMQEGVEEAANPIENSLIRISSRVTATLNEMLPAMGRMFDALAPQIEVFASGVLGLAQNALPGMFRAIEAGAPVTQGLADFLTRTGTGLSDFFDRISAHAPAAGSVFSSLGDVMANLLPILGELLGQGAELAASVLPMLSGTLGVVLAVVSKLGPALPAIVAGFSAMKIVSALSGPLGSFSTSLGNLASKNLPLISTAAGGASAALSRMGSALPLVGVAVGAVAAGMAAASAVTDKWVQALIKGGSAARQAQEEAAAKSQDDFVVIGQWLGLVDTFEDVKRKADEYRASLTPLERANLDVTRAQTLLNEKIEEFGPGSNEAEGAARALKSAQGELERQNADLERAIHGVTQAMIDQANQAMGAINADFAYQDALDGLEDKQRAVADAQAHLNDTNKDTRTTLEDVSDAQRAYAEGIWDTAQKAALASPMLDGLKEGTKEYDRAVQNLTLQSLVQMRNSLGPEMQGAVDGMIAQLLRGGASLDELGAKNPKPTVDANIDPLTGKTFMAEAVLDILAGRRPMPEAWLNADPLTGGVTYAQQLLDALNGNRPFPVADANIDPLTGKVATANSQLVNLNNWRPLPIGDLNINPLANQTMAALNQLANLGRQHPQPVATLIPNTAAAEAALNYAARSRTATVVLRQMGAALASGGKVGDAVRGFDGGGTPSRRSDGKLSGPGGPLDDLIPAITNMGEQIRVANDEWIINGLVSRRQGDQRMAALNAGRADIVMRPPSVRGFADGGGTNPVTGTGHPNERPGLRIENLNVTFEGAGISMDRQSMRQAASMLREELIRLDREQR